MPKFYMEVSQGSEQWRQLRMGKATASNFSRIVTEVRGEYSETAAAKYAREVAVQRLLSEETEYPIDHLPQISRGKAMEPFAVDAYHQRHGETTNAIGLVMSDDETRACSPDRISGDRLIGVEIKCPRADTHLEYIKERGPGKKYIWQVVGSMLVSGFEEWRFWSYHPGLDPVELVYARTQYEPELEKLENALVRFEAEVQNYVQLMHQNGYEPPIGKMIQRTDEEWQKLENADPNMWAIG